MRKKENIIVIILTVIGVISGYLYWKLVGCNSGSCPIFSRWHLTMLYGGFVGYFVGDLVKSYLKRRDSKNQK